MNTFSVIVVIVIDVPNNNLIFVLLMKNKSNDNSLNSAKQRGCNKFIIVNKAFDVNCEVNHNCLVYLQFNKF